MEPCPVKAAAACTGGGSRKEVKRIPEKLDLCVRRLSVGPWRVSRYLFGKLPPTKDMPGTSPCAGLSPLPALACCSGGGWTSYQRARYGFPRLSQSVSRPETSFAALPKRRHRSWELLECDRPRVPVMLGAAVGAGHLVSNLLQGGAAAIGCKGPRARPQSLILSLLLSLLLLQLLIIAITTATIIFQYYLLNSLTEI